MTKKRTLEDAFHEELRDVLSAEKQLSQALPRLAKAASNEQLREALLHHAEETSHQVDRLEQVFELIDKKPRAKRCEAMEGLVEEGKELLETDAEPEVLDAMLIGAAQKAEHYEIATYGTLCTWAEQLGYEQALKLLGETLNEEKTADEKLTKIASQVNQAALATK